MSFMAAESVFFRHPIYNLLSVFIIEVGKKLTYLPEKFDTSSLSLNLLYQMSQCVLHA